MSTRNYYPDADKKPTLACIGRLAEFGQAKDTSRREETGEGYVYVPVKLSGRAGSKDAYINFMFEPEWFGPDFNVRTDLEDKAKFVYAKNVASKDKVSVLEALCGSEEKFDELMEQLLSQFDTVPDGDDVRDAINTFIKNEVPISTDIAYVLKQKTEDTGETTEDGKKIKALANGYEVSTFDHVTDEKQLEKLLARWDKRVEESKKRKEKLKEKLKAATEAQDSEAEFEAKAKLEKLDDFRLGFDKDNLELPF